MALAGGRLTHWELPNECASGSRTSTEAQVADIAGVVERRDEARVLVRRRQPVRRAGRTASTVAARPTTPATAPPASAPTPCGTSTGSSPGRRPTRRSSTCAGSSDSTDPDYQAQLHRPVLGPRRDRRGARDLDRAGPPDRGGDRLVPPLARARTRTSLTADASDVQQYREYLGGLGADPRRSKRDRRRQLRPAMGEAARPSPSLDRPCPAVATSSRSRC